MYVEMTDPFGICLLWLESSVGLYHTPNMSPLESVPRLLVALERGSVETKGALPVDHTSTIKSVRAY